MAEPSSSKSAFVTHAPGPSPDTPEDACQRRFCAKRGTLRCSRCHTTLYCSKECQKSYWKVRHKHECRSPDKVDNPDTSVLKNCFVLATGPKPTTETEIMDRIRPFHLTFFGMEAAEVAELRQKLGWKGAVNEVAKFYDHTGSDKWYYFGYSQLSLQKQIRARQRNKIADDSTYNGLASLLCGKDVYGEVAVVRSGPVGQAEYPETFAREELGATALWYLTTGNGPDAIFAERERNRRMRNMGMPSGMGSNTPAMKLS